MIKLNKYLKDFLLLFGILFMHVHQNFFMYYLIFIFMLCDDIDFMSVQRNQN